MPQPHRLLFPTNCNHIRWPTANREKIGGADTAFLILPEETELCVQSFSLEPDAETRHHRYSGIHSAIIRSIVGAVRREQLVTFHEEATGKSLSAQSIIFSSNFEGGNLHSVFKSKKSNHYYLLLQNDINTHGYSIWFHFRVKAQQEGRYLFVIANLSREVKYFQVLHLLTFSSIGKKYLRNTIFKCRETMFRHCGSGRRYWALQF